MNILRKVANEKGIKGVAILLFLGVLLLQLTLWVLKGLIGWIGDGLIAGVVALVEFVVEKETWATIVEVCKISSITCVNALVFYIVLCIIFACVIGFCVIISVCLIEGIEWCLRKMDVLVLGKRHRRSLEYQGISLWYMKARIDILYFLEWIKFDILKIVYSYGEEDKKIDWIRRFSLENIYLIAKRIIRIFFRFSIAHLFFAGVAIYVYYGSLILSAYDNIKNAIIQSGMEISIFLELAELASILCLVFYVFLDIKHRANAYSELRVERIKELIQIEEKLYDVLGKIIWGLRENIDMIAERKGAILQNGATQLNGQQCYIDKSKIEFEDDREWGLHIDKNVFDFYELTDMDKEFKQLYELQEELKKLNFNNFKIHMTDNETMLFKMAHFWIPGFSKGIEPEMEYLCKSSMEKWYKDKFIVSITNQDGERVVYSKDQIINKILDASSFLDYELMSAFLLELYLKKYQDKMAKRFKKIHRESKYNLS